MNNPLDDFLKELGEKSKKRKDAQKKSADEAKIKTEGFDVSFKDLIAKMIVPSMERIKKTFGKHGHTMRAIEGKPIDSVAYVNVNYLISIAENNKTCRIAIVGNHDLEKVVVNIDYPDSKIEKSVVEYKQEEITLDLLREIVIECVKKMIE
jgi:hypothetical protein